LQEIQGREHIVYKKDNDLNKIIKNPDFQELKIKVNNGYETKEFGNMSSIKKTSKVVDKVEDKKKNKLIFENENTDN